MNKEPILLTFGKNVQKYRISQGLSQEKLAELAGVHRTYIGMIERAEKNITLCNIEKIAKALNIEEFYNCLLYTSPSPRDLSTSRMPSSA